jgi:hypothetical protein
MSTTVVRNPDDHSQPFYPDITAIHSWSHKCDSCLDGTTVDSITWAENANPKDVAALFEYDQWAIDDKGIRNETGETLFELALKSSFDNYATQDFQTALKEQFMKELTTGETVAKHSGDSVFYPEARAVDPPNCGCPECLTGEYIPETTYTNNAKSGDLVRFVSGEVRNHTFSSDFDFAFRTYFSDRSVSSMEQEMIAEFPTLITQWDVEYLAERFS